MTKNQSDEFEILRGFPIPNKGSGRPDAGFPFDEMSAGDCLVVKPRPDETIINTRARLISAATRWAAKKLPHGTKVKTRMMEGADHRLIGVWFVQEDGEQ